MTARGWVWCALLAATASGAGCRRSEPAGADAGGGAAVREGDALPIAPARAPMGGAGLPRTEHVDAAPQGGHGVALVLPDAETDVPERSALVRGLAPQQARLVTDPRTTLVPRDTSFLKRAALYDGVLAADYGPVDFVLAVPAGGDAVILDRQASSFLDFVRRSGLQLDTDGQRRAYVRAWLEVVGMGRPDGYGRLLERWEDLPAPTGMSAEDEALWVRLRNSYASQMHPLELTAGPPWKCAVWATRLPRSLVRVNVTLEADGTVHTDDAVLEEALPIPTTGP
jgi:hypothetical protein